MSGPDPVEQSDGRRLLSRWGDEEAREEARPKGNEFRMTTASPPTRRALKQQTLLSMNTTPAVSTQPTVAAAATAVSSPPVMDAGGKRSTRAATQLTPPRVASPSRPPRAASPARPPRVASPARSPSRLATVPRTPLLRPRRSPSTYVGLRDPYEQHSVDALRAECERRGIQVQGRADADGKNAKTKALFVELLQEADMLAMFERQTKSQKRGGKRSVKAEDNSSEAPNTATKRPAKMKKPVRQSQKKKAQTVTPTTPAAVHVRALPATPGPVAPPAPVPTQVRPPPHVPSATTVMPVPVLAPNNLMAHTTQAMQATLSQAAVVDLTAEQPNFAPASALPSSSVTPVVSSAGFSHQATAATGSDMVTSAQSVPETQPDAHATPSTAAPPAPASAPKPRKVSPKPLTAPPSARGSGTRARRGCRFRLINVILSPDFNRRWEEMFTPTSTPDGVNDFWCDLHVSYLCQNSIYDKIHYKEALFDNVGPDVIIPHTAQKLQLMWNEIVMMYRRASNAAAKADPLRSFFDSCSGRVDLLYLHMGLLLQPELHSIIVSDGARIRTNTTTIGTNDRSSTKTPTLDTSTAIAEPTPSADTKSDSVAQSTNVEPVQTEPTAPPKSTVKKTPTHRASHSHVSAFSDPVVDGPRFVELQNPEMLPDWLIEDQTKTAVERGMLSDMSDFSSPPVQKSAPPPKKKAAGARKKKSESPFLLAQEPVQTRDLVLHSSAINSIDDDTASSDYENSEQAARPAAPPKRRAPGKRRRDVSTDLVEVPSSRDLVPHPHKRLHTAVTTTMTRSQELMLPPDEFDVLHNRLKKINESIDQCYRTLSNSDAILNDMHREDVESDLRFYLGIKKRIQEQIVMFMHGF